MYDQGEALYLLMPFGFFPCIPTVKIKDPPLKKIDLIGALGLPILLVYYADFTVW